MQIKDYRDNKSRVCLLSVLLQPLLIWEKAAEDYQVLEFQSRWDEGSWTVSLLLEYNLDTNLLAGLCVPFGVYRIMEVWLETLELYNDDHFHTRQTSNKSAAPQVLRGLKTGLSGCFQLSHGLKAESSCPKAKRQSWQWQHQQQHDTAAFLSVPEVLLSTPQP